jgi:AcrR family transcriptional regulator
MTETFQAQVAQLRRTQILNAAIKVFAERGFHRTTIRDVAKTAGVADGTIYNYFENKTALLLAILAALNESERREADLAQMAITDVRQFFRHYFAHRWSVFEGNNLQVLRVVLSEVLVNPELRALYVERVVAPTFALAEPYVQQLVDAGKLRAMDVPLTLRAIASTFLGLVMLRLLDDQHVQDQWNDVPELLTTLLLDGMLPSKGDFHATI